MKAYPTQRNSQVTEWKLRQPLFSHQIQIVLLTVLHSEVQLGSAYIPPHFGLSFCNALEDVNPSYPIWKGTSLAFIWGVGAYPVPSIYRDMALVKDLVNPPSYSVVFVWHTCLSCSQNSLLENQIMPSPPLTDWVHQPTGLRCFTTVDNDFCDWGRW